MPVDCHFSAKCQHTIINESFFSIECNNFLCAAEKREVSAELTCLTALLFVHFVASLIGFHYLGCIEKWVCLSTSYVLICFLLFFVAANRRLCTREWRGLGIHHQIWWLPERGAHYYPAGLIVWYLDLVLDCRNADSRSLQEDLLKVNVVPPLGPCSGPALSSTIRLLNGALAVWRRKNCSLVWWHHLSSRMDSLFSFAVC